MKLITEYTEELLEFKSVKKENADGLEVKEYFIEGIFMQAEIRNRNGRIYEKKVLEKAVSRYVREQVDKDRAVGELNHPAGPTVNLDKVSHKIESLTWQGDNVIGRARILDTPMGVTVKKLLEGGVKLGVSSRGMGSITKRADTVYVKDDFVINTVDIVQDPSAHSAFVNGIMENVDWVPHGDGYIQVPANSETIIETQNKDSINTTSDNDDFVKAFRQMMSTI